MEVIFIIIMAVFASGLYLSFAPMHEIRGAIYYAEHVANQKHKGDMPDAPVRTATK